MEIAFSPSVDASIQVSVDGKPASKSDLERLAKVLARPSINRVIEEAFINAELKDQAAGHDDPD